MLLSNILISNISYHVSCVEYGFEKTAAGNIYERNLTWLVGSVHMKKIYRELPHPRNIFQSLIQEGTILSICYQLHSAGKFDPWNKRTEPWHIIIVEEFWKLNSQRGRLPSLDCSIWSIKPGFRIRVLKFDVEKIRKVWNFTVKKKLCSGKLVAIKFHPDFSFIVILNGFVKSELKIVQGIIYMGWFVTLKIILNLFIK